MNNKQNILTMNFLHSNFEFHFIHGFLGLPSDWDFVLPSPQSVSSPRKWGSTHFHSIDKHIHPTNPTFENWAISFQNEISFSQPAQLQPQKKILIGYSLGARLALHCLEYFPQQWDAAILISANPGLTYTQEKKIRIQQDELWSNRFLNDPWEKVIQDWNNQPVFSNQISHLSRKEMDFKRDLLAKQLTCFSLGKQKDFRPFLKQISHPILWMTGEKDAKFVQISDEIHSYENPNISFVTAPSTAHRIPWENSDFFLLQCIHFCNRISPSKGEHE